MFGFGWIVDCRAEVVACVAALTEWGNPLEIVSDDEEWDSERDQQDRALLSLSVLGSSWMNSPEQPSDLYSILITTFRSARGVRNA